MFIFFSSPGGILKFLRPSHHKSSPSDPALASSDPGLLPSIAGGSCRPAHECCGIRLREARGRGPQDSENTWLECDDENVRPLSQGQFEEMLVKRAPAQGTPYLLFYTRV